MPDRGATREEVEAAIGTGEPVPAKGKRLAFRKNFPLETTYPRSQPNGGVLTSHQKCDINKLRGWESSVYRSSPKRKLHLAAFLLSLK